MRPNVARAEQVSQAALLGFGGLSWRGDSVCVGGGEGRGVAKLHWEGLGGGGGGGGGGGEV